MMDREEWRTGILHACLQNGTCRIYDRAAARCTLDDTVRDCGYECCPWVLTSYLCTTITGLHRVI